MHWLKFNAFVIFSLTASANESFVPVALAIVKTQAGLRIRLFSPERRREHLLLILRRRLIPNYSLNGQVRMCSFKERRFPCTIGTVSYEPAHIDWESGSLGESSGILFI